MALIKCKMCGGDLEIREGQSVAECEYCGSRQTIPSADSEKKMTLFARAGRLLRGCEFDKAAGVFESIVADFPEEAEAYWGLVLCKYGIEYVDDPATGKKIPTCHRSSFESVLDDANFEQAMENADAIALKLYRDEAKQIERLRKGILEVSSGEAPYDIFICYKETAANGERTVDSLMAQDIYDALTDKGYRVFFSRITLEDKLGEAFEPYIFAALHSAKVMLAIGSSYEYYNAVWVKNEWSRYLKIVAADKSRHLIPCYRDLEPEDMPREFQHLQGVDLGRMGAVQDLLRNMEKYIPLKKETVITERVVVGGSGDNKIASLLDRGNMALEDGDWAKADSFFEDVLNNDSKNAQAYLGKTLAEERCRTIDAFVRKRKDATANARSEKKTLAPDAERIAAAVEKYALPGFLEEDTIRGRFDFDFSYLSAVPARRVQVESERRFWAEHKLLSRAEKFAVGAVAENLKREKEALFTALADRLKKAEAEDAATVAELKKRYAEHLDKADKMAEAFHKDALNRREKHYQAFCTQLEQEENLETLRELAEIFTALNGYSDSPTMAERCETKIQEIEAKQAAEAERQRIIAAEEAERQRVIAAKRAKEQARKNKRNAIIFAIVAVLGLAAYMVYSFVLAPAMAYKEAEALLAAEDFDGAAAAFAELGDYKDAAERSQATFYAKAEALLEAGNFDGAAAAFAELGDYKDAAARKLETQYLWAKKSLEDGNDDIAMELFAELNDYKDSSELFLSIQAALQTESQYQHAVSLLKYGPDVNHDTIAEARGIFLELGDYADAELYLSQIQERVISISRHSPGHWVGDDSDDEHETFKKQYNEYGLETIYRSGGIEHYKFNERGQLIDDGGATYEYNEQGLLVQKTSKQYNTVTTFSYDRQGNLVKSDSGASFTEYKNSYEGDLLVEQAHSTTDGSWLFITKYSYDEENRLVLETHIRKTEYSEYASTYEYIYDDDGRLIKGIYDDGYSDGDYEETYIYGYVWTPKWQDIVTD